MFLIQAEFNSVQETIADLSLISFELVKDCHWGDLDMTLHIYGAGGPETEYPVYEARIDTEFFWQKGALAELSAVRSWFHYSPVVLSKRFADAISR
ncbi:hypothetical protein [Desulfobotulus mexicanus]|uniref:Uncharacterized protein n=1 Tax=Desulfobotulus mexicanus TaxID=2586642 RepID=A0A5S5MDI2_9BACT|nr:hypothetical protein [Desulfobotulus mexicanus]TYT73772.1 hypothetical protein FIM25_13605 [Desulfobotulus mexicanus]